MYHKVQALLANRRMQLYVIVAIGLCISLAALRGSVWQGSAMLHTIMEVIATLLALIVGAMALVRFYSQKNNTILFIGAGFLGTALLDGYHALVTSSFFQSMMASDLPALIPWSWVASRLFLSVLLFLSWLAWRRERDQGPKGQIPEATVYLVVCLLTAASFAFFVFVPLPQAYFPGLIFHRPEEFIPALFFSLALAGYLRKGAWRDDPLEHFLVLSLIVGVIGQAGFMSFSGGLFDVEFDAAHLLKKISYILVLVGLMVSMYKLFSVAEERGTRIRAIVDNVIDGIITIDSKGRLTSFNPAAEAIFGYTEDEVIGRNVRMLMTDPGVNEVTPETLLQWLKLNPCGKREEMTGQHKGGGQFPMEFAVSVMRVGARTAYVGLCRDITESKKIDRMKNEFVSVISHELRTPLTSLLASIGLVRSGAVGALPGPIAPMIEIAHSNGERLVRLVNDILDMEKIEAARMEYLEAPVELGALLDRAVLEIKGLEAQYKVTFAVQKHGDAVWVSGDPDRLIQTLTNLLSNAAKFSPEGGEVTLTLRRRGAGVRIEVIDCGPGIPESFRSQIFGKFAQADASDTRRKDGTGLGLSICKAIVDHHGGTIDFKTEIGVGTTFYMEFPKIAPPATGNPPIADPPGSREAVE